MAAKDDLNDQLIPHSSIEPVVSSSEKIVESSFSTASLNPSTDQQNNNETATTSVTTPNTENRRRSSSISSSIPNLYHKFVESFDAVLQNLATEEEKIPQKLPSLDIEGIVNYIKEENPRNIIFMVGAGISTSAGIPDFRSPAGLKEEKVIHAHGSYQTSTCLKCKKKFNKEWLESNLYYIIYFSLDKLKDSENLVPKCTSCNSGVVKPDIIFFGEKLPNRFFSAALGDFPKCDLLIIMGTSLIVQPFASMVEQVSKDTPRLLINLTPVGQEEQMMCSSSGLSYGKENNIRFKLLIKSQVFRDVFWQGNCDDGAIKLARLLGWENELNALLKKG